jgi:hypothetical protein
MRHPALLPVALFAVAVACAAGPAAAQYYGTAAYGTAASGDGYGHSRSGWNSVPSTFDWRSQLDRPGDYRCDAYWDAARSDCAAPWRDQRRYSGHGATRYDFDQADHGYATVHDRQPPWRQGGENRYGTRQRGLGQARYDRHDQEGGTVWNAAYGRPDLVYPGDGYRPGRDDRRVDWCRARYRSYDPASGYYRAYSGRRVFCGLAQQ